MTSEEVVRPWNDAYVNKDIGTTLSFMSEDFIRLGDSAHWTPIGKQDWAQIMREFFTGFPDWQWEMTSLTAAGNRVVCEFTEKGTFTDPYPVMPGLILPPTGESYTDHCPLWNDGNRDARVASWRTIAPGALFMNDPVGTELKHGPDAADYMGHTFDLFHRHLNMQMLHVKANGPEMAWVIESRFGQSPPTISIETFHWEPDGTLHVKTFYDMPSGVGEKDNPYRFLLAKVQ